MRVLDKILKKIRASSKNAVFNLHIKNAAPTLQQFLKEKEERAKRNRQFYENLPPPPLSEKIVPVQVPPVPTNVVSLQPTQEDQVPEDQVPEEQELTVEEEIELAGLALQDQRWMDEEELLNYMEYWVQQRKEVLEQYSSYSEKAGVELDPSLFGYELGADPKLYRELLKNPEYKGVLSNKIIERTGVNDERKANLFVNTVLEQTKSLLDDMVRVEQDKKEKELELEKFKKEHPEFVEEEMIELPDIGLAQLAQNILIDPRLDREEVFKKWNGRRPTPVTVPSININKQDHEAIANQIATENEQNYKEMISEAVRQTLGKPSLGKFDPRMEFFLVYPKYLLDVIKDDVDFQRKVVEKLMSSGAEPTGNINIDFPALYNKKNKGAMLNLLAREKGTELQKKLEELILEIPNQPDVMAWLKRGTFGDKQGQGPRRQTSFQQGDEEGSAPSENLQKGKDKVILEEDAAARALQKEKQLEKAEALMDRTTKKLAAIGKYYLKDAVDDMEKLSGETLQAKMNSYIKDYKKATTEAQKKQILIRFTRLEKLNVFSNGAIDQLRKLFTDYRNPRPSRKDASMMKYQNNLGEVMIPINILQHIFNFSEHETIVDKAERVQKFEKPVDEYKKRVRSGEIPDIFEPSWRAMVNYRVPFLALSGVGKLKSAIVELGEEPSTTIDEIRKSLDNPPIDPMDPTASTVVRGLLSQFANVDVHDEPSVQRQKKDNFIFMTLQQNEIYPRGLSLYKNAYKQKNEIEAKYKNKDEQLRVERNVGKNMNAEFGTKFAPMLPVILQAREKRIQEGKPPFPDKIVRGFIDLFDHHKVKIRGFSGTGQTVNPLDPQGRTNTELYYLARNEEIPEGIKNQMMFSKDKKLQRLNEQVISIKKQIENRQNNIAKAEEDIRNRIEKSNAKLYHLIGRGVNPNVANRNLHIVADKIADPAEKREFVETMEKWMKTPGGIELPYSYYALLGEKKLEEGVLQSKEKIGRQENGVPIDRRRGTKENKKRKKWDIRDMGLKELEKDLEKRQLELDNQLAQKNLRSSENGLRLMKVAYPRFANRVEKLFQMRELNCKLSYVGTIDKAIVRVISEYDNFLYSIFPKLS